MRRGSFCGMIEERLGLLSLQAPYTTLPPLKSDELLTHLRLVKERQKSKTKHRALRRPQNEDRAPTPGADFSRLGEFCSSLRLHDGSYSYYRASQAQERSFKASSSRS